MYNMEINQIGDERFRKVKNETSPQPTQPPTITKLEQFYERHNKAKKKWREKNKEYLNDKQRKYMQKLKGDTERYNQHLEKRREYYAKVLVPRKKKILEDIHDAKSSTLVIK